MRSRSLPELPAGAISDIAFLLLIFFVTTTQILDERGIRVTLPRIDAQPAAIDKDIFHVHINKADEILANGLRTDIRGLQKRLHEYVVYTDTLETRHVVISLRCDRETTFDRFIDVHDAIRKVFRQIWEETSLKVFSQPFSSLNEGQKNIVRKRFPLILSEAEWNR